jgi:hypothetical protein
MEYGGGTDKLAPQLSTVFADDRTASMMSAFRVFDWDWAKNQRGGLLGNWPVTLLGLKGTTGEVIRSPSAGYDIGWAPDGYQAVVLYASENRLTLNYTRDASAAFGYTLHFENFCVDPNLVSLYQTMNTFGRARLPALLPGQALGRLKGSEIDVAVRDTGSFMDPRSHKDWWQGR